MSARLVVGIAVLLVLSAFIGYRACHMMHIINSNTTKEVPLTLKNVLPSNLHTEKIIPKLTKEQPRVQARSRSAVAPINPEAEVSFLK